MRGIPEKKKTESPTMRGIPERGKSHACRDLEEVEEHDNDIPSNWWPARQ
jgi:hypothetical protein